MNNYLYENILSLVKLKKYNERFFESFTDGYSNIYLATTYLVEQEMCTLSASLGYGMMSLAEQNDVTPVYR
ncbi:MAG: hypothetical protein NW226_18790 [Microscillaceae bacterium]|nr:hypothetical protein [Microscillaceae bacterium]